MQEYLIYIKQEIKATATITKDNINDALEAYN